MISWWLCFLIVIVFDLRVVLIKFFNWIDCCWSVILFWEICDILSKLFINWVKWFVWCWMVLCVFFFVGVMFGFSFLRIFIEVWIGFRGFWSLCVNVVKNLFLWRLVLCNFCFIIFNWSSVLILVISLLGLIGLYR